MRLFIAEKPCLARAIADALPGPATRARDHIRCGPNDVVAWCAGHILETAPPDAYDARYRSWQLEHLPIVPRQWKLEPKVPELLRAIRRLLKDADRVVHAGDPDREGQLLVDEVLDHLGYRGPVDRLLVNDPTPEAVRKQLAAIGPNAAYRPLSQAALARQRADWLFGMNMTRLYTVLGRQGGYDGVLSIGRVQTPLLGLIVRRDRAIEAFRPVPYYTLTATMRTDAGARFRAAWVPGPEHEPHLDESKRLLRRELALAVANALQGARGTLLERSDKPHREAPPLPYALSALQVDAAKRLGVTAQQVLDAAQSLYETHQLITYPRSDCSYLPEAHHSEAAHVLAAVARQDAALAPLIARADPTLRSKAWADAKVTAHHAIIPTRAPGPARCLSATEGAVYALIARRYLAQFYPHHELIQSELALDLGGERFRATGRQVVTPGWKDVFVVGASADEPDVARAADESANPALPPIRPGDTVHALELRVADKKTQPPKRFTNATIVEAMCRVAAFVTDPAAKKILSDTDGIGTEATRASIIETLFDRGYVERVQQTLVSTPVGRALVDALPPVLTTPDMTAVWEAAMRAVVDGHQSLDVFLARIDAQLRQLVEHGKVRGPLAVAKPAASAMHASAGAERRGHRQAASAGRPKTARHAVSSAPRTRGGR